MLKIDGESYSGPNLILIMSLVEAYFKETYNSKITAPG
jgi:hypothetical protein